MTEDAPRSVLAAALALPDAQQRQLLLVLQDVPDIRRSLQYIAAAPPPLCPTALRAHLTVHYAERWQVALSDVPEFLSMLARSSVSAPPELTAEVPAMAHQVVQRLETLLAGGWTPPRVAEAVTATGINIGRGAIRQLSRGRHLHKASDALLTALQALPDTLPLAVQADETRLAYRRAMRDLTWTCAADLRDFLRRLPAQNSQPVQDLMDAVGDNLLNSALTDEGSAQEALNGHPAFSALTDYLTGLVRATRLHAELRRVEGLGWTAATLTTHLRPAGYNGPALQAGIDALNVSEVEQVTRLLQQHVRGGPTPTRAPSERCPITRTDDRIAYVQQVLAEKGVITPADIIPVFGLRHAAAMTFLRQTMKLQASSQGQYRRPR